MSAHLPETGHNAVAATGHGARSERELELLREIEALFAALAGVFPIGIFRIYAGGVLTHVDESLQRIFGLQAEDFPDFGWLKQVHPDDIDRVRREWTAGTQNREPVSVELRLLRPGQDFAHVLVRNAPLQDANGQPIR